MRVPSVRSPRGSSHLSGSRRQFRSRLSFYAPGDGYLRLASLSQLDDQLAAAYSNLLATVPTEARATVRQNERDWLRSIECPANAGREALVNCLELSWDKRVRLLQTAISSASQPGPSAFPLELGPFHPA